MLWHKIIGASGTRAWDLRFASYTGLYASYASQDDTGVDLSIKPDGTKLYMVGSSGDAFYQYSLTTPYDISTLSYDSVSLSFGSSGPTESIPGAMDFGDSGTKLYLLGRATDKVHQYNLSTAWDLSSASYSTSSSSFNSVDNQCQGLRFKPDGTKAYLVGNDNDSVYQFSLSTAWDISTLSYDSVSFYIGSQETAPYSLNFKPDGARMFVGGNSTDAIYQYNLSTPWDISSASYSGNSFSTANEDGGARGIFMREDGRRFYFLGNLTDTIYEYSMG